MIATLTTGISISLPDAQSVLSCGSDLRLVRTSPRSIKAGFILPFARMLPVRDLLETVEISNDLKLTLTYAFGYLVGHYLGDGGAYNGALNDTRFRSSETAHLQVVAEYLNQVDLTAKPIHGAGRLSGYYVNNAALYRWFRRQFDVLSHTKVIPDWVFSTPVVFREGVLDGLLSTDGAVDSTAGKKRDETQVNIGLVNHGLIDSIAVLCRTLGILVSVHRLPNGKRVTISPECFPLLKISHPRKAAILARASCRREPTRGYHLVVPWNEQLRQALKKFGLRKSEECGLSICYVKKGYMSLVKARRILEKHSVHECSDELVKRWVGWVQSPHVVWVRVTSVDQAQPNKPTIVPSHCPNLGWICPRFGVLLYQQPK